LRTKKTLNNTVGSLALQLLVVISGLILPRLLITTYGSMINGLITSIRQVVRYLLQLEMGLANGVIVELYKPLADKDDLEVSSVLSASRHFYNRTGLYFSVAAILLSIGYPFVVDCQQLPWYYVTLLVLLLSLPGAINFFLLSSHRVLIIADQRSYILSAIACCISFFSLGATVAAILFQLDIVVIPIIQIANMLLLTGAVYLYSRRTYLNRFRFDMQVNQAKIPQRKAVFVHEFSQIVESNGAIVVATLMLGLTSVSVLAVYSMVVQSLQAVSGSIQSGAQASFGELTAIGGRERLLSVANEYEYLHLMFVGWIYSSAAILLLPFINFYTLGVTDADYRQPLIGILLLGAGVIRQIRGPSLSIVTSAGKYRQISVNAIQTTVLGVVLAVLGTWTFGMPGLLLSFLIAVAWRTGFIVFYCHRELLDKPLSGLFVRLVKNLLLFVVAAVPFLWIDISTETFLSWIVWAICVSTWVGIVFVVGNLIGELTTFRCVVRRLGSILSIGA
jgi:O-antigen/teichoic acid export membrane protein